MNTYTDAELDEMLLELAKRGDFFTRESLRECLELRDSKYLYPISLKDAELLGYRGKP